MIVAIHGGAGYFPPSSDQAVKEGLRRACISGAKGVNSLDAVVNAVIGLEEDEIFNAGFGSNLTEEGNVECDASIMTSEGDFGGIGAVSGIKNPVKLAYLILEDAHKGRRVGELGRVAPLTLVSIGAESFARKHYGNNTEKSLNVSAESMISRRSKEEWETWHRRIEAARSNSPYPTDVLGLCPVTYDTVGAVTLDTRGRLASAVSSGGILLKPAGRLGHAAIYGAGCWSEILPNGLGIACSISGTGEAIIRSFLAKTLRDHLSQPDTDIHAELSAVLNTMSSQHPSAQAGILLVTSMNKAGDGSSYNKDPVMKVRVWCAFTTPAMAIAWTTADGHIKVWTSL